MSNEAKACEAVVRIIEGWASAHRRSVRRPEKDADCPKDRRIDFLVRIGDMEWAIEHTLIEPFQDFIGDSKRIAEYAGRKLTSGAEIGRLTVVRQRLTLVRLRLTPWV